MRHWIGKSLVAAGVLVVSSGAVSLAFDGVTSLVEEKNKLGHTYNYLSRKCNTEGWAQAACFLKPGSALATNGLRKLMGFDLGTKAKQTWDNI